MNYLKKMDGFDDDFLFTSYQLVAAYFSAVFPSLLPWLCAFVFN